jgi:hypothetical protein
MGLLSTSLCAEQIIVSGDGKKYQLHDDGSWEVLSEDRILDTEDGRRVVLKTNGRWEYLGLAPEINETKFQTLMLAATIKSIDIDETREAVGGGKNTRISYRTKVKLQLSLADTATSSLNLNELNSQSFGLSDNRGKKYPIVAVTPDKQYIKPGETTSLMLVSHKGPKRLRQTSEFILEIDTGILGNDNKISLSFDYGKVKRNTQVK